MQKIHILRMIAREILVFKLVWMKNKWLIGSLMLEKEFGNQSKKNRKIKVSNF